MERRWSHESLFLPLACACTQAHTYIHTHKHHVKQCNYDIFTHTDLDQTYILSCFGSTQELFVDGEPAALDGGAQILATVWGALSVEGGEGAEGEQQIRRVGASV